MERIKGLPEVDGNTKIARYFSRDKLEYLIQNDAIWISNSKLFSDEKERQIPMGFFKNWDKPDIEFYQKLENNKRENINAYISCWTEFCCEKKYFWDEYDGKSNGACLITTVKKLKEAIHKELPNSILLKVDYVNLSDQNTKYELPWFIYDDYLCIRITEKFKEKSEFAEEEEIRFIDYRRKKEFNEDGFTVKVNLKDLIDEIIISPFSSPEVYEETNSLLLKKFDSKIIHSSKINEK